MVEITAFLLYNNDMGKTYESAAEWQALLAKKEDEIASLSRQVALLTQQLRLMQGQRFGASSEWTQVVHELPEEERVCLECGGMLHQCGQTVARR